MGVWRGFSYTEAYGSPAEQWADDQCRALRTLDTDWNSRIELCAQLVGYPQIVTSGSVTYISRTTPQPYTAVLRGDGTPFLYATAVNRCEPQGRQTLDADGDTARYVADPGATGADVQSKTCRLSVEYRSPLYDVVEDSDTLGTSGALAGFPDEGRLLRYVERYYEPAYKYQVIPKGIFQTVEATPKAVLEGLNKVHAAATIIYLHRMRPDLPIKTIITTVGRVNDSDFDGYYPAGTLLCLPPRVRPYASALGMRLYDVRFAFAFMPNVDGSGVAQGWNAPFVQRTTGAIDYFPVSSTGAVGGQQIYRTASFSKLFQPSQ